MKRLLSILISISFLVVAGRANDVLVTAPGKYQQSENKISLEISSPNVDHILWRIAFKTEKLDPATGRTTTANRSIGSMEPSLIAREKWAFCLGAKGDVWFYDGIGSVLSFKAGQDGLIQSAKCSEPEIEKRVPAALRLWMKEKEPTKPAQCPPTSN